MLLALLRKPPNFRRLFCYWRYVVTHFPFSSRYPSLPSTLFFRYFPCARLRNPALRQLQVGRAYSDSSCACNSANSVGELINASLRALRQRLRRYSSFSATLRAPTCCCHTSVNGPLPRKARAPLPFTCWLKRRATSVLMPVYSRPSAIRTIYSHQQDAAGSAALSAGGASASALSTACGPESSGQGDREYSKDDTAFLLSILNVELLSIVAKDDHWRTQ